MAVTEDQGISFEGFHFVAGEFDELLNQHGAREAELLVAMRCGCWDPKTGEPDPACATCYPFGYVYSDPVDVAVFGPNRKPMRRFEMLGAIDPGDAFFTFPSGIIPSFGSRIVLPQSVLVVDDLLVKGKQDFVCFTHVLALEKAHYSVRTPPTGAPYEVSNVALDVDPESPSADVWPDPLDPRSMVWATDSTVPDGTPYVVRLRVFAEYVCWDDGQDRQENGVAMPSRYLCKRLARTLKHPRSGTDITYPT